MAQYYFTRQNLSTIKFKFLLFPGVRSPVWRNMPKRHVFVPTLARPSAGAELERSGVTIGAARLRLRQVSNQNDQIRVSDADHPVSYCVSPNNVDATATWKVPGSGKRRCYASNRVDRYVIALTSFMKT
jgi:hypothetical protein